MRIRIRHIRAVRKKYEPIVFASERRVQVNVVQKGQRMKPNILLLCLDSARPDRLSCYGYGRRTTPNLDALAAQSVLFRNAVANAPWTVPSHASLFTGLHTIDHRTFNSRLPDDVGPTMAEVLRDVGYSTAAVTANPWLTKHSGMLRGFATSIELPPSSRRQGVSRARRGLSIRAAKVLALLGVRGSWLYPEAREVNGHVISLLRNAREPFFLFANYMDTHAPYLPAWPHAAGWSPTLGGAKARWDWWTVYRKHSPWDVLSDGRDDLVKALGDLYDGDLANTDGRLGELIDWVQSRRWQRPVVLIVFSDHGENLGDHGLVSHFGCLYDTLLRVVLIISAPGLAPAGVRIEAQVQLSDVMPSILRVLGSTWEREGPLYRDRPSLLDMKATADRDWSAYAEYYPGSMTERWQRRAPRFDFSKLDRAFRSIRTSTHKYIAASDGSAELFDIQRDPAERDNLLVSANASEMQRTADLLHRQLKRDLPEPEWASHHEDEEYEAEAAEQLRGLGYL